MTEPTLDTLTQRLDRVEREVRWWRLGALAMSLVVVIGAVWLLPRVRVANFWATKIEAQQLVIRSRC